MNIKEVVEQRSVYGTLECNAEATQQMEKILKAQPNYDLMPDIHKEVFHMILQKMSRAVCGDFSLLDNIVDIQGYAYRLQEWMEQSGEDEAHD